MTSLIRSISLRNFKGFSDEVRIDLRPITLLFGANSAGKSSVLQALQYVNEVLIGGNLDADSTRHGGQVLGLGGFHNLVHGRDFAADGTMDVAEVRDDDKCPNCGSALSIKRGIEIGHVFQLGRKYADVLGLQVLDANGKQQTVTMMARWLSQLRAFTVQIPALCWKYSRQSLACNFIRETICQHLMRGCAWKLSISLTVRICPIFPRRG